MAQEHGPRALSESRGTVMMRPIPVVLIPCSL
jgi:hypothetical protein